MERHNTQRDPLLSLRNGLVFCGVAWFMWGMISLAEAGATKEGVRASFPMWTRANGHYTKKPPTKKRRLRNIVIASSDLQDRVLWDDQSGRKERFLVVDLMDLLKRYKPNGKVDLALLHFTNQMVVPLPLKLLRQSKRPKAYVALALWSKQDRSWTRNFGSLMKAPNKKFRDLKPLVFSGNKIVVHKRWNPAVAHRKGRLLRAAKGFHPWRYVSSLKEVEFVNAAYYYGQFPAKQTIQERKGLRLFRQICQYCHGVRRVGAKMGWDFVLPYPIYKRRSGMSLFYHIKYRSKVAVDHGSMMPAVKGMTIRDAFAIWYWLRGGAQQPLLRYGPPPPPKKRPKRRKPTLRRSR